MFFSEVMRITNSLIDLGCKRILLSGGEPTLHYDFAYVLDYIFSTGIDVGVVTNGTTDSQVLIDAYKSHKNMTVQVSLDGSCEEVNARTRGAGNFDKAVSFISKLKCDGRPPIILKMVISQNNIDDIEAFYKFALSIGCEPDFSYINAMGNAVDNWSSLGLTAQQKLSVLRTVDRLNKEHGLSVPLPFCTCSCPLSDPDSPMSVLIKCDGIMMPCQALYDDEYSIGNLLSHELPEIEKKHKELSELIRQRETPDDKCKTCLARIQCRKGCMAVGLMNGKKATEDDGECEFRKLQLLGFDMEHLTKQH